MEERPRKKPGPKPTGVGELIGVRLLPELLAPLDAWAAEQDGPPSRPEAIRRILADFFKRRAKLSKKD